MFVTVLVALLPLASSEIIANMFEWSHDDIAKECRDFFPVHNYDAVQVSPVIAHAVIEGRPWFERYQPFSYKLISRSGNKRAFMRMLDICNKNKIKVYVDVVINHMSASLPEGSKGSDGSQPDTCKMDYPDVPYGPEHFHPSCTIKNWTSKEEIRTCELVGLHDLNQTMEYVRGKIVDHMNHLVRLGVAGFRVDAAMHMKPSDLKIIFKRVRNLSLRWFRRGTRPYFFQEIFSGPGDIIQPEEYVDVGGVLDFRFGSHLSRALKGGNQLKKFYNFGVDWGLLPWNQTVVFIDNHDSQRTGGGFGDTALSFKQNKEYKMATGFMLAWYHQRASVMSSYHFNDKNDGPPPYPVPIHINGTCSGGWVCEHRWKEIYSMVTFAKIVEGTKVNNWWSNDNSQIAFCRGTKGFIAINAEQDDLNTDLQTCLTEGIYCDIVSGSIKGKSCTGKVLSVRKNGLARVMISGKDPEGFIAIHSESRVI